MAKKKKVNIGKAIKKAAKDTNKAVIKPTNKAVVQPINKAVVQPINKAVVQPINKAVVQPTVKAVTPAPAKKKSSNNKTESKYKKQSQDCENKLKTKTTEITNLKYQIDGLERQNKEYVYDISNKNKEITSLNNKIGSLNKTVNTLDTRINAGLVPKEGFRIIEGFPENPEKVERSDAYVDYDIRKSGLLAVSNEYKTLYGDYYAGYQDNETMIQDVLNPTINYLSVTDLDGMEYSYVALQQQNKTLQSQIEDTADEYSTDFQRAKYAEEEFTSVKKRNAILFFGFYLLFFIFAYALFTGSDLSIYSKIGVLLFLFVYPYLIAYISRIISFTYDFSLALFRGVPM